MSRNTIERIKSIIQDFNNNIEIIDFNDNGKYLKLKCKIDNEVCETNWNSFYQLLKINLSCPKCAIVKINNELKDNFIKITDEKYINSTVKMNYTCLKCNHNGQRRYSDLKKGYTCHKCAREKVKESQSIKFEDLKIILEEKFKNIKFISQYFKIAKNGKQQKMIKCKCKKCNHEWDSQDNNLMSGKGCAKCSKRLKLTIEEVKNRMDKNIDLLSKEYKNAKTPLELGCKICGNKWIATWDSLNRGSGCPMCANKNLEGTYTEKSAEKNKSKWKNEYVNIYVIECKNNNENFYKIGISKSGALKRFGVIKNKRMPYDYKILCEFVCNRYNATYLEKELHKLFEHNKYIPSVKFQGYTECFDHIDINLIKEKF